MDFCSHISGVVDLIRDYLPPGLELFLPSLFPRARHFYQTDCSTLAEEAIEDNIPCLLQAVIDLEKKTGWDRVDIWGLRFHLAMTRPHCFSVLWKSVRQLVGGKAFSVDVCLERGLRGEEEWFLPLYSDGECFDKLFWKAADTADVLWRVAMARNRRLFETLNGSISYEDVNSRIHLSRVVVRAGVWWVKTFLKKFCPGESVRVAGILSVEACRIDDRRLAGKVVRCTYRMGARSLDVAAIVLAGDHKMLRWVDTHLTLGNLLQGLRGLEGEFQSREWARRISLATGRESRNGLKEDVLLALEVLTGYLEGKRLVLNGRGRTTVSRENLASFSKSIEAIMIGIRGCGKTEGLVTRLNRLL